MMKSEVLSLYVSHYQQNILSNTRVLGLMKKAGITERFLFETFMIGYSDGSILQKVESNDETMNAFKKHGLI